MIITDKSKIQEKCLPTTIKEGEEIGIRLLDELRKSLANVIGYFEEKYIAIENILSNIGNGREKN